MREICSPSMHCVTAGFREVLCFWRYSGTNTSPSVVAGARRGRIYYDSDYTRRGLARTQWTLVRVDSGQG